MWHWSVLYCTHQYRNDKSKISKYARFKFKDFSRIFEYFQAPYLFSSTFKGLEIFIPNSSIFKDFSSTLWTPIIGRIDHTTCTVTAHWYRGSAVSVSTHVPATHVTPARKAKLIEILDSCRPKEPHIRHGCTMRSPGKYNWMICEHWQSSLM